MKIPSLTFSGGRYDHHGVQFIPPLAAQKRRTGNRRRPCRDRRNTASGCCAIRSSAGSGEFGKGKNLERRILGAPWRSEALHVPQARGRSKAGQGDAPSSVSDPWFFRFIPLY